MTHELYTREMIGLKLQRNVQLKFVGKQKHSFSVEERRIYFLDYWKELDFGR
jgi:hypothetical protein